MSTPRRNRRVAQTAALTMGALAVGTVTAPAALAMQDPDAMGAVTPEAADAATPRVLTPAPVLRLGSVSEPVDFGLGKATISIAAEAGSSYPAGVALDLSGATVQVTATGSVDADNSFLSGIGGAGTSATCITVADGSCLFPATAGGTENLANESEWALLPGITYTITQLTAPPSGQLLLPSETDRTVYAAVGPLGMFAQLPPAVAEAAVADVRSGAGTVDPETGTVTTTPSGVDHTSADVHELAPATTDVESDPGASITFFDPGAYRTVTATVTDDRGNPVPGATLALCTVAGQDCADGTRTVSATSAGNGVVAFPGSYLPGTYRATVTAAPSGYQLSAASFPITVGMATTAADAATPASLAVSLTHTEGPAPAPSPAAAPTTPTASGDQLASTGFAAGPVAAVAGGLVATGAAALLAARRRRAS
jgi:LPXTG-motif cell wall-anchored protein